MLHHPQLGPLSTKVHTTLSRYTAFPWPLMSARCHRHRIDARDLTPTTLGFVIQDLALGVARFNGTEAGFRARRALVAVLRQESGRGDRAHPVGMIAPSPISSWAG